MNHQANAILGLLAETSIHAGTGQSTGVIDLPIQREGHNGWPCVFGSAVKGALRNRAVGLLGDAGKESIRIVFGPEPGDTDHAGALAVGDARLLLLPVRSLTSHFKWVTCPAALDRLSRDAARGGIAGFDALARQEQPRAGANPKAWTPSEAGQLFLEELRFEAEPRDLQGIVSAIARLVERDGFEKDLRKQLVIVADDEFQYLCAHTTPVNAHVRLDPETKTVSHGALWYEETLPPETLLYVVMSAFDARVRKQSENGPGDAPAMPAGDVLAAVTDGLFGERPYLQVGGNETVGMGWCAVHAIAAEG